ncbi:MAG: hypothetical protein RLP11_01355, partial [Marinoscillum sp.]|uniref:hypothetical protein n=1 Tax=Marinoscillum sp. TaxID=2024838 RepID=UPI00330486E7
LPNQERGIFCAHHIRFENLNHRVIFLLKKQFGEPFTQAHRALPKASQGSLARSCTYPTIQWVNCDISGDYITLASVHPKWNT